MDYPPIRQNPNFVKFAKIRQNSTNFSFLKFCFRQHQPIVRYMVKNNFYNIVAKFFNIKNEDIEAQRV